MDNVSNRSESNYDVRTPYENYIYVTMTIVGLALNVLVITAVLLRPSLIPSKIARALIVQQCASDSFSSSLNIITLLTPAEYQVPANWLGDLICRLWFTSYLFWSSVQASINSSVLLTIDRYVSIVYPIVRQQVKMKHIVPAMAMCWIAAFAVQSGSIWEGMREGNVCVHNTIDPIPYAIYGTVLFTTYFIVPLVVLVFSYSHMIHVLQQQEKRFNRDQPPSNRDRVARSLCITVGIAGTLFCILHAPNAISYFLFTISVSSFIFENWFYRLTVCLVNLNFVINPLVYAIRLRPFQEHFQKMLCRSTAVHPIEMSQISPSGVASNLTAPTSNHNV